MSKRANPMAVKATFTYEISEAAQVLGKTPATIRNWIKDGLPVMTARKPFLLSGEAIREYLRAKNKLAKRPLTDGQLFCPRCRVGRAPQGGTVSCSPLNTKISLLRGVCGECGGTSTRMISLNNISDFRLIFKFK